jgi:hypothetical protein
MDIRDVPPPGFGRRPLRLTVEPAGSTWQRIYEARHPSALGCRPSPSRFSDPSGTKYGLVYIASSAKAAFAEVILRDRAIGTMDPFLISTSELEMYACADIEIVDGLKVVDLTGNGLLRLHVPTDVTGASDQTLARIWSEAFFDHPDSPDGILYNSRLTKERNIALFERAVGKLKAKATPKLVERRDELAAIIRDFDLAIV